MKKTLALILAIVMVALMLPVTAITVGAEEPYYYYTDFTEATPDNASDGTIADSLPTGWTAIDSAATAPAFKVWPLTLNYDHDGTPHSVEKDSYVDVVKPIGVRLVSQDTAGGIAMTDASGLPENILNATTDYTLTVKWNTTHKFARINWGWSGVDADGAIVVPTKDTTVPPKHFQYNYTGGPSNKGNPKTEGFGDSVANNNFTGGNFSINGYCDDVRDEYGSQLDFQGVYDLHGAGAIAGNQVTTTMEIVGGKLVAVHNTIDGSTITYFPKSEFADVKGYICVWITNWGANCTANIQSVEIKEGALIGGAEFPEVSNTELLHKTDFSTIKTDAALAASGYKFFATKPADSGDYVPKVDFVDGGIALNAANYDFLINTEVELDNDSSYIIDYSVKMNPEVWIFNAAVGIDPAAITSDAADDAAKMTDMVAKLKANYDGKVSSGSTFKMRGNINDKKMACDGYTYFDEEWMQTLGATIPSATALEAACGAANESIRVRILVSKGTGQYVFMTIGNEHFYLKRNTPIKQDGVAGLFGFTFNGQWNEGRGMLIERASITKCDLGDTTGGDAITPDKTIDYTDEAATYYKDGYVLHNMDFSKVADYASTGYSFAANSAKERRVVVERDVLSIKNTGSKAAYLMFTGNAIPKNITEYTANFKFRFVGDVNSYFGFIRGISLRDDGARDSSKTVEITYKDGEISDCVTEDTAVYAEIVEAMKAGEWVEVSVSNVMRKVDVVTIKCGDKTATFKMEAEENKAVDAGYMGFILGKTTEVEIASVTILAGIAANAATPIWPEGVTAGDLVQNVTVAAVNTTGTKPVYDDPAKVEDSGDGADDGADNNDAANTPEATTTAATTATEKKGCGGSIVAVPAIIATAVLGCAVTVCKKKED